MPAADHPEVRIIVLEKGEHLDTVVRRLEKGAFSRKRFFSCHKKCQLAKFRTVRAFPPWQLPFGSRC